ncbi:MAG: hypothetical protein GY899_00530 [Verrucomicrobiaceae bacterium]|nr:hypothetical protein [Verrucomicrobiaceae bacterium]
MQPLSKALLALLFFSFVLPARSAEKPVNVPGVDAGRAAVLQSFKAGKSVFTPALRAAFLGYARDKSLAALKAAGTPLPGEFIDWVDSDPSVATGVYATHGKPEDVLLWLYSLRLDLGKAKFEQYRQLALAAALVSAKEGMPADITPRAPLKLKIPGDPRKVIDTKYAERKLDVNDHIINFLNENTIEEAVVVSKKKQSKLKYDDRGIAIPGPDEKKGTPAKASSGTRTRNLYAADVLASLELQSKFNAYMKSKGLDVSIDCGEKVIHWDSKAMVRGETYRSIDAAYKLFRQAYEAKGLLPVKRDAFASPAERCVYLIRNHEYKFPPKDAQKRKWPQFPLTAPWPLLTMLAADRQPLREREERWIAFRDHGEFHKYGEYIGGIAQQHSMQSARRLKPYPFAYGTIQMMLKDGGVCGTMGSISARGHNIIGVPSSQATQPGHCAVVFFQHQSADNTFSCKGGQYATGGDEKTGPFTPWPFEDAFRRTGRKNGYEIAFHNRKPMVYHQSLAWGVNYGFGSYMDATIAHSVFNLLPKERRAVEGLKLLEGSIAMNPYHFLIVDTAQQTASSTLGQIRFWNQFVAGLASAKGRPGCPLEGLYKQTVRNRMFERIAKLPVPKDKKSTQAVLSFLEGLKCEHQQVMNTYRKAAGKPQAG